MRVICLIKKICYCLMLDDWFGCKINWYFISIYLGLFVKFWFEVLGIEYFYEIGNERISILYYVRVLVEMLIEKELFECIIFENEWGVISYIALKYEWKLVKCWKCGMFGFEIDKCKKG